MNLAWPRLDAQSSSSGRFRRLELRCRFMVLISCFFIFSGSTPGRSSAAAQVTIPRRESRLSLLYYPARPFHGSPTSSVQYPSAYWTCLWPPPSQEGTSCASRCDKRRRSGDVEETTRGSTSILGVTNNVRAHHLVFCRAFCAPIGRDDGTGGGEDHNVVEACMVTLASRSYCMQTSMLHVCCDPDFHFNHFVLQRWRVYSGSALGGRPRQLPLNRSVSRSKWANHLIPAVAQSSPKARK